VSFIFQLDPQAITHNQHHKGEGNAGIYSRALQSVQPPTKQQRDCHQPFKRVAEPPLGHWGVQLAQHTRVCKFNIGAELRQCLDAGLRAVLADDLALFDRGSILRATRTQPSVLAADIMRSFI